MNLLDLIIAAIILFCLVRGIFRGMVKEVSSIVGVLGGFYAGYTYYPQVSNYLKGWISNPIYLNTVSFLLIFFIVLIIIATLGVIIKYLLNITSLGWSDRVGGALLGSLKGVLIVSSLLVVFTAFLPKGSAFIKESILAPYSTVLSEKMASIVSKDMKHKYAVKSKELKKIWKN
jgi:membrane protein required for colicin V production